MSFAEELADARKNNNLTQEELAEMLDVSRQTISKWERNEGYPEVETLLEIARRLHLSYLILKVYLPSLLKNAVVNLKRFQRELW